jgi:hypothetical protein
MPFFGGPSNNFLVNTAQGIAHCMYEANLLTTIADPVIHDELKMAMKKKGQPTTVDEVLIMASKAMYEMQMGFFKKNHFLGTLDIFFRRSGFSATEARYFITLIEEMARRLEIGSNQFAEHENTNTINKAETKPKPDGWYDLVPSWLLVIIVLIAIKLIFSFISLPK